MSTITSRWHASDARHLLHPFGELRAAARKPSRIVVAAEHIWLTDADGRTLLDGMSGMWCVNQGYGEPVLVDAAARQLTRLSFCSSFGTSASPPAIDLAEQLCALAPPGLGRVFFTNSGSEATETALRLVHRYWTAAGAPNRRIVIARAGGYHGSTLAAAAVSGMKAMRQPGPGMPTVAHIDAPYSPVELAPADAEQAGLAAARRLQDKIEALGPENVAAFIAEPVQAAGGVIVPPPSYWPEVRRICGRYGILLVSDEVVCGFGRVGTWFGCEAFGYRPDLLTFSKGVNSGYLPLGGVLVSDRITEALDAEGGVFAHGFTCSGHPVACAVALANIRLMHERGTLAQVRGGLGPRFAAGMRSLHEHPLVVRTESFGLMGGVHLDVAAAGTGRPAQPGALGQRGADRAAEAGLVARAIGERVVLAPPLVTRPDEADELFARLRRGLDMTLDDLCRGDIE